MKRRPFVVAAAIALVALLVAGTIVLMRNTVLAPRKITAIFTTASSIYPGDEVKVAGVKVGRIDDIEPMGPQTKFTMRIDRDIPIPADAKAIAPVPGSPS